MLPAKEKRDSACKIGHGYDHRMIWQPGIFVFGVDASPCRYRKAKKDKPTHVLPGPGMAMPRDQEQESSKHLRDVYVLRTTRMNDDI